MTTTQPITYYNIKDQFDQNVIASFVKLPQGQRFKHGADYTMYSQGDIWGVFVKYYYNNDKSTFYKVGWRSWKDELCPNKDSKDTQVKITGDDYKDLNNILLRLKSN